MRRHLGLRLPLLLLGMTVLISVAAQDRGYVPKDGFIPDEKTAVTVAEAILTSIYGQKQIASEKPLHATLDEEGAWTVKGILPKGFEGGVAELKLSRRDGRVQFLIHGK